MAIQSTAVKTQAQAKAKAKAKAKAGPSHFLWNGVKDNRKTSGQIEAINLQTAKLMLRRRGVRVTKIRKKPTPLFAFGDKVKVKDIVFLSRQLSTMIEAGIPIAQSLRGISQGTTKASLKKLLDTIRDDVESGTTLSSSLKKHPRQFNRLYTSLISVGEHSGTLDLLMNKVASYLEKIEYIKSKVRSAMVYPIIVLVVAGGLAAVLLLFVIPEFEDLFSDFGAELPGITKMVLKASYLAQKYWFILVIGVVGSVVVFINAHRRSTKVQFKTDQFILRIPVFGEIIRKSIIARISRTLSTMFGAGVPLVDALETVSSAAGNLVYTRGILTIRREVSTGRTLESTMTDVNLFPSMMLQMVATGEESGELEVMLNKVADFFETEVDNSVAMMSSLIEPILIIFIGIMVGTFLVAMYLPIFMLGSVF